MMLNMLVENFRQISTTLNQMKIMLILLFYLLHSYDWLLDYNY